MRGREQATRPLPCSRERAGSCLNGVRVGRGVGWTKGVTEVVCPPSAVPCRDLTRHLLWSLFPEGAVGLLISVYLEQNRPQLHGHVLVSSSFEFLCICHWRECLSGCKYCSRCLTSQPVPKTVLTKQRQTPSRRVALHGEDTGIGRVA